MIWLLKIGLWKITVSNPLKYLMQKPMYLKYYQCFRARMHEERDIFIRDTDKPVSLSIISFDKASTKIYIYRSIKNPYCGGKG